MTGILRSSLALRYISYSWRGVKAIFIPKTLKRASDEHKLYPISLVCLLFWKTMEKVIDLDIAANALQTRPHQA